MHYFLADQKAAAIESGARALLLNRAGAVLETSTANVLVYRAEGKIVTPPIEDVLPGISLTVVHRLATRLGLEWSHCTLCSEDIKEADEVFLSSTPFCLLPVTAMNGQTIGNGLGGSIFQNLIREWSREVGIDVVGQAQQFANR
jgi:branched-subunit amino acid aminotransferase/4-amino-4-deoxychorismate lyase